MTVSIKHRTLGLLLALTLLFGVLPSSSLAGGEALLDLGTVVNAKMKTVASNDDLEYWAVTTDIKAIRMADSLPGGFTPSDNSTVSAAESEFPVYIFFDNTDDAGIMYFYTEADKIVLNPDSKLMFVSNEGLADISCLADWDSSRVTDMYAMFADVCSLPDALALRNWDTSNVTDMSYLFSHATAMEYVDVSNWNTGNVTSMASMFQVGESWKGNGQLREIVGLGSFDTSNVRDMTCMFYGAGQMTDYDVAGWDVSKVVSMNHMFGDNFKLRSLDLSRWDDSSVQTVYCMFDDNYELRTIGDVSHWNTCSLIDAGAWINDAPSFVGSNTGMMDVSGWDTRNLKSVGEMFRETAIRVIDMSGWDFSSLTNDRWEGAGTGIFYETGNDTEEFRGMGRMFNGSTQLVAVYVSQEGLETLTAAVENGLNTLNMFVRTRANGFTAK